MLAALARALVHHPRVLIAELVGNNMRESEAESLLSTLRSSGQRLGLAVIATLAPHLSWGTSRCSPGNRAARGGRIHQERSAPMSEAKEITKKSQSNLAFAFFSLPKVTRRDITTFYAFCRHVDDAADDPDVPLSERRHWLQGWRRWLVQAEPNEPGFASELRTLIGKYKIDRRLFEEILLGVEMDLEPVRFENFEALHRYCYRVASAVGLVSIEIFGYRNSQCKEYAHKLGVALQLTNIIRDVDKDLTERRTHLFAVERIKDVWLLRKKRCGSGLTTLRLFA